jgi:hypothetical protein
MRGVDLAVVALAGVRGVIGCWGQSADFGKAVVLSADFASA